MKKSLKFFSVYSNIGLQHKRGQNGNILETCFCTYVRGRRGQRDYVVCDVAVGTGTGVYGNGALAALLYSNVRRSCSVAVYANAGFSYAAVDGRDNAGRVCGRDRICDDAVDCDFAANKSGFDIAGLFSGDGDVRVHGAVRIQDGQGPVVYGNLFVYGNDRLDIGGGCVDDMAVGFDRGDDNIGDWGLGVCIVHGV